MSAPTPAPGDDRPREGYYPDPSIPGYVRYWNGAAWVPGTSRPAPAAGETLPRPPGVSPAPQPVDQAPPSVAERGPVHFDEEPHQPSAIPHQGPGGPEQPGIPEQPGPAQPGRPHQMAVEQYPGIPGQGGPADQPEPSGWEETRQGGRSGSFYGSEAPSLPEERGRHSQGERGAAGSRDELARPDGQDLPEGHRGSTEPAADFERGVRSGSDGATGPDGGFTRDDSRFEPDDRGLASVDRGVEPDSAAGLGGGSERGVPARQSEHGLRAEDGWGAEDGREMEDRHTSAERGGRHGGRPERTPAWGADPSHQAGFGSDQDRRVSWGAPQSLDPRVPHAQRPGTAEPAGGTMSLRAGDQGTVPRGSQGTSGSAPTEEQASSTPAGTGRAEPPGEGTMTFRRPGAGPEAGDRSEAPPRRPVDPGEGGTVAIRAMRPDGGPAGGPGGPGNQVPPQPGQTVPSGQFGGRSGQFGGPQGPQTASPVSAHPQTVPYVPHQPGVPAGGPAHASEATPPWRPDTPQQGPGGHGGDEPVVPWKPPVNDPFVAAAQAQAASRPAALGKRFAARVVDTVVVGAVTAAAAVPLGSKAVEHINDKIDAAKLSGETVTVWLLDGTTGTALGIVLAVLLLVGVLYEALPTATWGCTLGKRLCGLQVRDIEAHRPPSFGAAVRRWLVYSVPSLLVIGLPGVLWCLFDRPWRQCWHDKAAHTFVAS